MHVMLAAATAILVCRVSCSTECLLCCGVLAALGPVGTHGVSSVACQLGQSSVQLTSRQLPAVSNRWRRYLSTHDKAKIQYCVPSFHEAAMSSGMRPEPNRPADHTG